MTIDHIIPKQRRGEDSWYNLVAACESCNNKKANKILSETNMVLIKKPRKPNMVIYLQKYVNKFQKSWRPYLFMKDN